jgi:hypothetical protein
MLGVGIGYGLGWMSTAAVALYAIHITQKPVWALLLLIPAIPSLHFRDCDCDDERPKSRRFRWYKKGGD